MTSPTVSGRRTFLLTTLQTHPARMFSFFIATELRDLWNRSGRGKRVSIDTILNDLYVLWTEKKVMRAKAPGFTSELHWWVE